MKNIIRKKKNFRFIRKKFKFIGIKFPKIDKTHLQNETIL